MVRLGGPSGLEHNPSQEVLNVSLSGVSRESNLGHEYLEFMSLTTEPQ